VVAAAHGVLSFALKATNDTRLAGALLFSGPEARIRIRARANGLSHTLASKCLGSSNCRGAAHALFSMPSDFRSSAVAF
jgi:hypothetical protein